MERLRGREGPAEPHPLPLWGEDGLSEKTDGGEYPYVETYLGCANTTKPPDKLARHEFEKNYRCWKLVQKQEQKRGQRYEWALRLRTDISYAVALPPFEVRFLALQ